MSLLETVLTTALVALVLVTGVRLIGPLMRVSLRGVDDLSLQQQALVALQRVRSCLLRSSLEGVRMRVDPFVLWVNRLKVGSLGEVMDNSGNLVWEPEQHLFFVSDERLIDRRHGGGRPSAAQLLDLAKSDEPFEVLSTGVKGWECLNADPQGGLRLPLKLALTLQRGSVRKRFTTTVVLP